MKQFQIAYSDDKSFCKELENIKKWCSANQTYSTVFRIYSEDMDLSHIKHVCDIIDEKMPEALYFGCTTNANILNGELSKAKIVMSCTVFEYATTQVKLMQFPFLEDDAHEAISALKSYCTDNHWVSAVEIHATVLNQSVSRLCHEISSLRSDIQIFGGGACDPNMDEISSYVFTKETGFLKHGIIFLLLGGDDFHAYSTFISGWKPLKRKFKVTRAYKALLQELDGKPAFNVYKKFLNIENNRKLVSNTLEFPLSMNLNGIDVMRCPWKVTKDNSIIMTGDMEENTDVRLSYGDPKTILRSIRHDGQKIADFMPEAIQIFSCASRRAFWGDGNVSDETILFNSIAPSSGFYTAGEFLRVNGDLLNFNITLVLVAMREGEPKNDKPVNIYDAQLDNIDSDKLPLISRFVSFIDASTVELEDLNKKLKIASITDGLTNLFNRTEIERRIRRTVEKRTQHKKSVSLSLIMLDIDDFKNVNDAYGHKEGDQVIITLSDILRKVTRGIPSAFLGRWGGEEFMVLLSSSDITIAAELAERIRTEFATASYKYAGPQTVSIGVIQAKDGEDADSLYTRVDNALYTAKAKGKNRIEIS